MPEYAKMKNAELEALLKERGLPHTGKKADMVERLQKNDEEKAAAPTEAKSAAGAEDEIDWDDDAEDTAAAPAAAPVTEEAVTTNAETIAKAGGEGQPPNPQAVPNQVADIDPSKTDDLTVQPSTEAEPAKEEKQEPAPDYSIGLAATNLDEEIEKRRKRALKFGKNPDDDEGLKKLERAKKFGETGFKGLDEALPERQRKRGREEGDDAGGNKRRGGARAGGRGRGGRDRRDNRENRNSRERDTRDNRRNENKSGGGGTSSWMSEKDRAAAEARKAKWAKPAA